MNFVGHFGAVVQRLDALEVKIMHPDAAQSTTEDWSAVYSQLEHERGAFQLGGIVRPISLVSPPPTPYTPPHPSPRGEKPNPDQGPALCVLFVVLVLVLVLVFSPQFEFGRVVVLRGLDATRRRWVWRSATGPYRRSGYGG